MTWMIKYLSIANNKMFEIEFQRSSQVECQNRALHEKKIIILTLHKNYTKNDI